MVNDTPPGRWFRRVLWIAIAGNIVLALPAIAAPAAMLDLAGLPGAAPEIWPRLAAFQALVLGALYVPAAIDVDRYRLPAWLAVAAHVAGAAFFTLEPGFGLFAAYDLVLALSLGALLAAAVRAGGRVASRAPVPTL